MKKILVSAVFSVLYMLSHSAEANTGSQNAGVNPETKANGIQMAGCAFDDNANSAQQIDNMNKMKQALRDYWGS